MTEHEVQITLAASILNLEELRICTWDPDLHRKCISLQQWWIIMSTKNGTGYFESLSYAFVNQHEKAKCEKAFLTYPMHKEIQNECNILNEYYHSSDPENKRPY